MNKATLSVVAWIVMAAAAVTLCYRGAVVSKMTVVIVIQVVAAIVMASARITFGRRSFHAAANPTEGKLVTWGPYRFVRNPIYASAILFFAAGLIDHFSWPNLGLEAILIAGAAVRCIFEEQALRTHYRDEYEAYAKRTARLIPFVF